MGSKITAAMQNYDISRYDNLPPWPWANESVEETLLNDVLTDPRNQGGFPEVIYSDPLWRCEYCGGFDTAIITCPNCGAPRHWR